MNLSSNLSSNLSQSGAKSVGARLTGKNAPNFEQKSNAPFPQPFPRHQRTWEIINIYTKELTYRDLYLIFRGDKKYRGKSKRYVWDYIFTDEFVRYIDMSVAELRTMRHLDENISFRIIEFYKVHPPELCEWLAHRRRNKGETECSMAEELGLLSELIDRNRDVAIIDLPAAFVKSFFHWKSNNRIKLFQVDTILTVAYGDFWNYVNYVVQRGLNYTPRWKTMKIDLGK